MVNDSTRGYSVYISDEHNSVQGSGVLFYAGGDAMFVFTCAHVVDSLERVRLFILKELKKGCAEIPCPCTVAARNFAHLFVVSSRQHMRMWLRG